MKCDDVVVNLPDYVLGRIEPNLRKGIENHLESCPKCKSELAGMERAIAVLDGIEREEYPDGFWQELKASIMETVSMPRPARWKVPAFAGGLAVLLLAIGIGVYEYSFKPVQPASTVAALAASLPSEQVVDLSNLNVNYFNTAAQPIHETDEISSVDDSLQFAVVNSMWASAADSSISFEDFDYNGDVASN
jgi:anti-sigma factor RsiW